MKKILTLLTILNLLPFIVFSSTVTWNFNTASPSSSSVSNLTVSSLSQGNNNGTTTLIDNSSPSGTYSGASGGNNAGASARGGALNTATSGSVYFEFTLTPSMNSSISLTGIKFGSRSTPTGPTDFAIRTSLDSYFSDYETGTLLVNSTWALKTTTPTIIGTISSSVTIRIYGYNGTATSVSTNWRIDDLTLEVTSAASALPVELQSFKAVKNNTAAQLSWQTATENNNSHFDIERSNDGVKFNKLDTVEGNGTTNIVQDYSFTDGSPLRSINYYRLRQVDFDGKETVSKTVSINFDGKSQSKAKVYPTLVKDVINIELSQDTKAEISVRDLMGRVVLTQIVTGGVNATLDLSSLPSGMYLLSIRSNEGVETVKIQKY